MYSELGTWTFLTYIRQSQLGEGAGYATCSPVNHQNWFGGPGWQALAPSTLTSPCPCLLQLHAEPNKECPPAKGKEVPVSGFLQTWPWPAPRSSLSELEGNIGTEPASPKVCATSLTPDKWGMEL